MVVHAYKPSTKEVEAGGSSIPDQPDTVSKIKTQNKQTTKFEPFSSVSHFIIFKFFSAMYCSTVYWYIK
jgi:hypothetical protein